jgi:glutaredoxin-related protein
MDILSDGQMRDYLVRMDMNEEGIRKSISNIKMYLKMRMINEKDFVFDETKTLKEIRGVIVKDGMLKIRASSDELSRSISTEKRRIHTEFGECQNRKEPRASELFNCLPPRKITPPLTPPQRPTELRIISGSPKHETPGEMLRRYIERDNLRNLNVPGEKDHIVREILRN